jgi:hypothetical protein
VKRRATALADRGYDYVEWGRILAHPSPQNQRAAPLCTSAQSILRTSNVTSVDSRGRRQEARPPPNYIHRQGRVVCGRTGSREVDRSPSRTGVGDR